MIIVDIKIQSEIQKGYINMPVIFNDVIRDTIANARKYTLNGGNVSVRIFEEKENFNYVIEDDGIGIPKSSCK